MKELFAYLTKCGIGKYDPINLANGILIPWKLCSKVDIAKANTLLSKDSKCEGFEARPMNPRPIDLREAQDLGVTHQCAIAISRGDDAFAHLEDLYNK